MSSVVPNIPDEDLDVLLVQAELNVEGRARKPKDVAKAVQSEYAKLVKEYISKHEVPVFQSDKAEVVHRRRLAVHEVAHSLVAKKVGAKVFDVEVDIQGGGVTHLDKPSVPYDELLVTVAGYVGVSVVAGVKPTIEAFRADPVNMYDVDDASIIVDDADLGNKPVSRAIEEVAGFLSQEDVKAELVAKARVLNQVRRLTGRLFN